MIQLKFSYCNRFPRKAGLLTLLLFILGTTGMHAQFAITEGFKNSTAPDVIMGDGAYLTSGVLDPVGAGWLRLTDNVEFDKGYAYINKTFPSTMGVLVDFEYKMWRQTNNGYNGADGIGVFLFDATATFSLGAYGGSLGYAPGGDSSVGLSKGYVGIGIDAYGNFANPTEGRLGGPLGYGVTAFRPSSIVMRGPTTTNYSNAINGSGIQPANRYLAGVTLKTVGGNPHAILNIATNEGSNTEDQIDYNTTTTTRPSDATYYRRMQIEVVRLDEAGIYYQITVRWKPNTTDLEFTELMNYITTDVPPALLKLGFAASTGGGTNNHEIRNLMVTTPGNVRVVKKSNKDILQGNTSTGDVNLISYTIEVTNDTDFDIPNIAFKDSIMDAFGTLIPEGTVTPTTGGAVRFNVESITPQGFLSTNLPVPSALTSNVLDGTLALAASSTGKIIVTGRLYNVPPGNVVMNKVSAIPPLDEDLNNNTFVIETPVMAPGVDLIVTKTVTEECINTTTAPTFSISISNIGLAAASYNRYGTAGSRLAMYVTVPAGYGYDDSATVGGFTGSSGVPDNGNTNARWSKVVMAGPGGSTIYGYIARGTSSGTMSLGSGLTYPYPVLYKVTPSSGATSYEDITSAIYFINDNFTTPIEPAENLVNNNANIWMYMKPAAPAVASNTINYCVGAAAVPLTATATGSNTLRYYSSAGGFASDYPITPNTDFAGSYTYYISQVNGECEGPTTAITVNIGPAPGTISTSVTNVCSGGSVGQINGTVATNITGQPGSAAYQWEKATSASGPYSNISGATGQNLTAAQASTITQTTYFRRKVTWGSCTAYSNIITIVVASGGTIGNPQTFCGNPNNTGDTYDAQVLTSLDDGGNFSGWGFQWQRSTDNTNWVDISGATGETYDPPSANVSIYYYRRRKTGTTCGTLYSNTIIVNKINTAPNAGTLANQTICGSATPTISGTPTSTVGTFTYQWQQSPDNTNWTTIASATEATYTPIVPITATTYYRRRTAGPCTNSFSGYVTATISIQVNPGSLGADKTLCYNTAPGTLGSGTGTSAATTANSSTPTYSWQSAPGTTGGTFTTIGGATSSTYSPGALTQTTRFRRVAGSASYSGCNPYDEILVIVKIQTDAKTISSAQNLCNGGAFAQLTGLAAVGEGAVTYQWQSSTDNVTFANVASGGTGLSYTPATSGYYRRNAITSCGITSSNSVLVTSQSAPSAGTAITPASQTVSCGASPAQLNGSAVNATAPAVRTYLWEVAASTNGPWSNAPGTNNGEDYTPPATSGTFYYRRTVLFTLYGNECQSAATTPVSVTSNASIVGGTIVGGATFCTGGGNPANIISSNNGSGGTLIKWQYSINSGVTWLDIAATGNTYDPGAITQTTQYRRVRYSTSPVCEGYSNVVTFTVNAALAGGAIEGGATYCPGGGNPPTIASSNVGSGGTAGVMYAWQSSINNGSTWTDIATNASTYDPPAITQTTQYRRVVKYSSNPACEAYSNVLTFTVQSAIGTGTFSGDQTVCGGTPAQITGTPGTGSGVITYRWEVSANNATWATATGTNNEQNYTPPTSSDTRYYRRVTISTQNSVACEANGTVITVSVASGSLAAGSIQAQGSTIFCNGSGDPLSINNNWDGGAVASTEYFWQYSTDNGNSWTSISSTNSTTYDPPVITQTTMYRRGRRYTSGGSCGSYTNTVTFTVRPTFYAGTISGTQTVCYGASPAQLTGPADSGLGTITYQWQRSTNGGSSYDNIATGQNYQPENPYTTQTHYRRITIDTYNGVSCQAISNVVIITMHNQISPVDISGSQTICAGTAPAVFNVGAGSGSNPISYRWEQSSTTSGPWAAAAGTNNVQQYQAPALTATTYYRRFVISTVNTVSCELQSTSLYTVNVQGVTNPGSITSGNQSLCYNTQPTQITATAATIVGSPLNYRWEQSSTGLAGSWSTAQGNASEQNYTPQVLTATTYFRRIVHLNNSCPTETSGVITVLVQPQMSANTISGGQSYCANTVPTQLTGSTVTAGAAAITYLWQQSATQFGTYTNAIGTNTGVNYQPPELASTTYYRRIVYATLNGITCTNTSQDIQISIWNTGLNAGTVSATQTTGCTSIDPPNIASTATGDGGINQNTFRWQFSTDGGISWTTISGATSASYDPPAVTVTTRFRRGVVNNQNCAVYTTPLVYTVVAPTAGSIGGTTAFCPGGGSTTITSTTAGTATAGATITYRWESAPGASGGGWTTIGGQTGPTLNTGTITSTTRYRRLTRANINSTNCDSAVTNEIIVTVQTAIVHGSFSGNQTVCDGGSPVAITGTASTGTGTITYRWETSDDGLTGWATAAGTSNGLNYTPPANDGTSYYRRVAISTLNSVACESNGPVVQVTMQGDINPGTYSGDQTLCGSASPVAITGTAGAGSGTITYRWDVSVNGTSGWAAASGTNNQVNYTPPTTPGIRYYRRATISTLNGAPCEETGGNVVITVLSPDAGVIGSNQSICVNSAPATIASPTPGTGSGNITYRWESSANGTSGWTTIPGATSPTYAPPVLTETIYYRRVTIDTVGATVCEAAVSAVMIEVKGCKVITNPMIYQRVHN